MQLFYISEINGDLGVLDADEAWHCLKVLRLKEGDSIDLTGGKDMFYRAMVTRINPKRCEVEILSRIPAPASEWNLHIAIAPTKNIDRFEWFLEKSTEIGITEITPLFCEHSEREVIKAERLEKVLLAAMKQSLRARKPVLHNPVKFKDFISTSHSGQKFIGYCETGSESELVHICRPGLHAVVLIGPEGDFSLNEVELASRAGFIPVSLGPARLRTETAGIVACHTINLLNRMHLKNEMLTTV